MSLKEKHYDSQDFSKVKEMKVFRPTAEEFKDPIEWIESKFEECKQYGCIKVIPPASMIPKFDLNLNENSMSVPTRKQTLQNLQRGVPFIANPEGLTVKDFVQKAKIFEEKYFKDY